MSQSPVVAPTFPIDLTGRVAVVTGASRRQGIGAAICRALAAQGAGILFTHWQAYDHAQSHGADADGPATLERELHAMGVRAVGLEIDLSLPDSPARVLDARRSGSAAHDPGEQRGALDPRRLQRRWTPPRSTRTMP